MTFDMWLEEFKIAYKNKNFKFTGETEIFLKSTLPEPLTEEVNKRLNEPYDAMTYHLFQKAVNGISFGDENRILHNFGMTLEQNYGVSSGYFLDLARSYWTFKIEMQNVEPYYYQTILYQLLAKIELDLASRFFPTPGPASVPNWTRKITQRTYLESYAPQVNIDEYFKSNPYFFKSGNSGKSGCLGVILIIAILSILLNL